MPVRRIVALSAVLCIAGFAVFVVERLWLLPVKVPSRSMTPELRPGDRVIVDQRVGFEDVERGDVVVFRSRVRNNRGTVTFRAVEEDGEHLLVKRVIAVSGEAIQAHDGVVAIDDTTRLRETYVVHGERATGFDRHEVRRGTLWVMGDNRSHSRDSRDYGSIPRAAYVGVVRYRYWPLSRRGAIG